MLSTCGMCMSVLTKLNSAVKIDKIRIKGVNFLILFKIGLWLKTNYVK